MPSAAELLKQLEAQLNAELAAAKQAPAAELEQLRADLKASTSNLNVITQERDELRDKFEAFKKTFASFLA